MRNSGLKKPETFVLVEEMKANKIKKRNLSYQDNLKKLHNLKKINLVKKRNLNKDNDSNDIASKYWDYIDQMNEKLENYQHDLLCYKKELNYINKEFTSKPIYEKESSFLDFLKNKVKRSNKGIHNKKSSDTKLEYQLSNTPLKLKNMAFTTLFKKVNLHSLTLKQNICSKKLRNKGLFSNVSTIESKITELNNNNVISQTTKNRKNKIDTFSNLKLQSKLNKIPLINIDKIKFKTLSDVDRGSTDVHQFPQMRKRIKTEFTVKNLNLRYSKDLNDFIYAKKKNK